MLTDVLEPGNGVALYVASEAVDELGEEGEGFVAGTCNIPGAEHVLLCLVEQRIVQTHCQEILQKRRVYKGEVVPSAREKCCCSEVLCELVGGVVP